MGKSHSKTKKHQDTSQFGDIYLTTDKQAYFGGETVSGQIYLNLIRPFPGNRLFLKFKGKEIVHLLTKVHTGNGAYYDQHNQKKELLIDKLVPVHTWDVLEPGQYVIPFNFITPDHLSSSFHQQGHRYLGNITYKLQAILEPDNPDTNPRMQFKQQLVIRAPLKNLTQESTNQLTTRIKAFGIFKNGSNTLKVHFDKNWYAPGEIVNVQIELDNSECKVSNKEIIFSLKQQLHLKTASDSLKKTLTVLSTKLEGLPAKSANDSARTASLQLPYMQSNDYNNFKHENIHSFLLGLKDDTSVMHSTTQSKFISSEYVLEVSCPMKGFFNTTPKFVCPIEICYPDTQRPEISAPGNWQPVELNAINVSFASGDDISLLKHSDYQH